MNTSNCLKKVDLWAVLDGNAVSQQEQHLENCGECLGRLNDLKSSQQELHHVMSSFDLEDLICEPSDAEDLQNDLIDDEGYHSTETISRYRILRSLSYGGQGQVYLAEDSQLNRKVAIKIAHSAITENVVSSELILVEGELLAKVNHPQLAQVYDAGIEQGRPYIVMEYVEGTTLAEYLRNVRLTNREIRRIILEIARAVQVIHECGILHLDLKPENVIVQPDGKCKVVDLGISWLISQVDKSNGNVLGGTVAYMSPEQFNREKNRIGPWTDVFGLGALLYALLRHTHSESTNLQQQKSSRLWERGPLTLNRETCDKHLKKNCLKAINKNIQDRFQSVNEFIESFERVERSRQAVYLAGTGVLSLVIGMSQLFHLAIPTSEVFFQQEESVKESQHKISLNEIELDQRYIQIHAIDVPEGPMQFCLWSRASGPRYLPTTREVNEEGVEILYPRSLRNGIEVQNPFDPLAIILIASEYVSPTGKAEFNGKLLSHLRDLGKSVELESQQISTMFYSDGEMKQIQLVKRSSIRNIELYELYLKEEDPIEPENQPPEG